MADESKKPIDLWGERALSPYSQTGLRGISSPHIPTQSTYAPTPAGMSPPVQESVPQKKGGWGQFLGDVGDLLVEAAGNMKNKEQPRYGAAAGSGGGGGGASRLAETALAAMYATPTYKGLKG